jgi:putative PIN family toxin of toxin-antitoxin system
MAGVAEPPLRLVLDTNVVVAGLLWSGPPRRLMELAIAGDTIALFSSPALLDELTHTLGYPKFAPRLQAFDASGAMLVSNYAALVSMVSPTTVLPVVLNDTDDDHVIAAAVAARAQMIVTGDRKHLLPIGSHQGIAIVTARDLLDRLALGSDD